MLRAAAFVDDNAVVMLTGKLFGLQVQIVQMNNDTRQLHDATEVPTKDLGVPRPLGKYFVLHRPHCALFGALVSKASMTHPVDDPCGPDDVSWVVNYLTELLEMNFQTLVAEVETECEPDSAAADADADGEVDGETDSNMVYCVLLEKGEEDAPQEHVDAENDPQEHVVGAEDDAQDLWRGGRARQEHVVGVEGAPQEHVVGAEDGPQEHVDEEDEWMPRVRVTTPRSWRRTGRGQHKHRNQRLREKRHRRRRRHPITRWS
ncbi:unnamed protein product [Ectocarpus sp. CCAP 1310/34]|nr:unnamed protein product [Ectocarpus sp. CCAP 1310/34]